ncbi:uncharacterized protein LOC127745802 isoform X2 [Arachis duranensis]|uniref:Uncharacterized protein LOC127745802 isoform X2 n=1 Tax=Arachis duranensis TaxID=130453 RepID=A0A9C6WUH1_ARADU|nr:uncharacterized protein LOC127745802 isoform X2 [Arachis duranensis]
MPLLPVNEVVVANSHSGINNRAYLWRLRLFLLLRKQAELRFWLPSIQVEVKGTLRHLGYGFNVSRSKRQEWICKSGRKHVQREKT